MKMRGIEVEDYRLGKNEMIFDFVLKVGDDAEYCLIFACGDGTISNAINGIVARKTHNNIGVTALPMGTANVFAKELNIKNYNDTIKAIINNNIVEIPLLKVNGEKGKKSKFFLSLASVGIDSLVVHDLDENLKKKIGRLAYIMLFLKNIFKSNDVKLSTVVNNVRYSNVLTCVCKGRYYGGRFKVANNNLKKDDFDVIIIKKFRLFSGIKYYFTKKSANISLITTKSVEVGGENDEYPVELDGDYFCYTPISVSLTDMRIKVYENRNACKLK
jgi:diacylglycerol kinase family enzyme